MTSDHETDPAALSSSEDLDEDRLRADPLEAGMDPPEHWSGADKYGTTPYEQAHPRPLGERLAEEEPDVGSREARWPAEAAESVEDERSRREAAGRGQSADEAGGSMAAEERTEH